MKQFIFILLILNSLLIYSQDEKVFYYRDTGTDTLFLRNKTFKSHGSVGLAISMIDSGVFTKYGDTLFLERKTKTLINNIDSVDNTHKIDTVIVIDNETMAFINYNNYGLYKLIEVNDRTGVKYQAQYTYTDTLLTEIEIKGKFYEGIYINNYPVKNGMEIFYENGREINREEWKMGKKINSKE